MKIILFLLSYAFFLYVMFIVLPKSLKKALIIFGLCFGLGVAMIFIVAFAYMYNRDLAGNTYDTLIFVVGTLTGNSVVIGFGGLFFNTIPALMIRMQTNFHSRYNQENMDRFPVRILQRPESILFFIRVFLSCAMFQMLWGLTTEGPVAHLLR